MSAPEILTDSQQMLVRALAAKDAEIERLRGLFIRLREEGHDKQCCKDLDDLVVDAIGP